MQSFLIVYDTLTMSSSDKPYWICLEGKGDTWNVISTRSWPNFPIPLEYPKLLNEITSKLQLFDLNTKFTELNFETKDPIGNLLLRNDGGFIWGIWIPETFTSLFRLLHQIFKNLKFVTNSFEEKIEEFHSCRLREKYLSSFIPNNSPRINIAPSWLLNSNQISQISPQIESIIDQQNPDFNIVWDMFSKDISTELQRGIQLIPAEREIILLKSLQIYFAFAKRSDQQIINVKSFLDLYFPTLSSYIWLDILQSLDDIRLTEWMIRQITEIIQGENLKYTRIIGYRILGKYQEMNKLYGDASATYQELMDASMYLSWVVNYDVAQAQLGLARISMNKGAFFRALSHYSFAKQFFPSVGSEDLIIAAEKEQEYISVMAISQILQAGLYQLHSSQMTDQIISTLLDGLQQTLILFTKPSMINRLWASSALKPLVNSTLNVLGDFQDTINDLLSEDFPIINIRTKFEKILVENPSQDEIQIAHEILQKVLSRDKGVVERVTVFYIDGRHMFDIELQEGQLVFQTGSSKDVLFTSALSAINMMMEESSKTNTPLEELKTGWMTIMFERGINMTAALMTKSTNPILRELLRKIIDQFTEKNLRILEDWSGQISLFRESLDLFKPLINYMLDQKPT